jgi:hypothetical protein
MDTSQPGNSKVGQVGQVGLSPAVSRGGTRDYNVVPSHPRPASLTGSAGCPTSTKKTKSLPEPWPPIEFALPNLDQLEEISRGEHIEQRHLLPESIDPALGWKGTSGRMIRGVSHPGFALATYSPST